MKNASFNSDYARYYDIFNRDKDYYKEIEFLESVFRKYSGINLRKILNLGCGTGLHEFFLSKKGYNLTGLDLSEDMIEIARSRKIQNTEFLVANMTDFSLNKKFDACISMFASFGYLLENRDIDSSIKCVSKHLNKNGIFLIEVWNGLAVLRILPDSRKKEITEGELSVERQSFPKLDSFNHNVEINFKVNIFQRKDLIETYQEIHKMRFFFPQ